MRWFLGMLFLPVGFCLTYIVHSIRRKRYRQAATIGVLILLDLLAAAVLVYEFLAVP